MLVPLWDGGHDICSPQEQQGLLDHTCGPGLGGGGGVCQANREKERPGIASL